MTLPPIDLAAQYAEQEAVFRAARPDLEGLAPCCGHCVHISRETIGTHGQCALDAVIRVLNHECANEGFTYDARPLWEQYPWISKQEWQRKDGMLVGTEEAFKDHVAAGGSMDDLPTLRVGGKRLVFPVSPGVPLGEAAFTEDPYGLLPTADAVSAKLNELQAARAAKAKGAA